MGISALFMPALASALCLFEVRTVVGLGGSDCNADGVNIEGGSSLKCTLQGSAHLPAFSMEGDYIIGGVFSIHANMHMVDNNYTTAPEPLRCTGRLVIE